MRSIIAWNLWMKIRFSPLSHDVKTWTYIGGKFLVYQITLDQLFLFLFLPYPTLFHPLNLDPGKSRISRTMYFFTKHKADLEFYPMRPLRRLDKFLEDLAINSY